MTGRRAAWAHESATLTVSVLGFVQSTAPLYAFDTAEGTKMKPFYSLTSRKKILGSKLKYSHCNAGCITEL